VHLNVPARTDFVSVLLTKAKWVLMALFAPEIVLYMAADQLIQALRLKKMLNELQEKSDKADKNVSTYLDREPPTTSRSRVLTSCSKVVD
jgi:hypothetical protein